MKALLKMNKTSYQFCHVVKFAGRRCVTLQQLHYCCYLAYQLQAIAAVAVAVTLRYEKPAALFSIY